MEGFVIQIENEIIVGGQSFWDGATHNQIDVNRAMFFEDKNSARTALGRLQTRMTELDMKLVPVTRMTTIQTSSALVPTS